MEKTFSVEDVIALHAAEGNILANVQYYLWLNSLDSEEPFRLLFYLELIFENGESLLLTSGEDSSAISVSTAEELVKTARALREMHDKISIQRAQAVVLEMWQKALGKKLEAIRLSKNDEGKYLADAVILDFGPDDLIMVNLSHLGDGLEVAVWEEDF